MRISVHCYNTLHNVLCNFFQEHVTGLFGIRAVKQVCCCTSSFIVQLL